LKEWTNDSSEFKQYMWGISENNKYRDKVLTISTLFDKYESNVKVGTVLYRGMSIPDDLYYYLGYDKLDNNGKYSPDEKAITSFSVSKDIAYQYAKSLEFNKKVIIKLIVDDNNGLIDISDISTVPNEREVVLNKGLWYNIKRIKKINKGDEQWLLMVIQTKE